MVSCTSSMQHIGNERELDKVWCQQEPQRCCCSVLRIQQHCTADTAICSCNTVTCKSVSCTAPSCRGGGQRIVFVSMCIILPGSRYQSWHMTSSKRFSHSSKGWHEVVQSDSEHIKFGFVCTLTAKTGPRTEILMTLHT